MNFPISPRERTSVLCINHFFNIPLDHIILDELHLMQRITDVLIGNVEEDAMQWGDKKKKSPS